MLVLEMRSAKKSGDIAGTCAKCGATVYEALGTLDDAYNVWAGRCPSCRAINLLALTGMRGYSSSGMNLVLPTACEVADPHNNLPADTPATPCAGKHPDGMIHGSISGEIAHRLTQQP